ncbi:hypothetical protein COT42_04490 [Candidatus Saganbacteria bacterium CG08_land_8_20_14_0_20_45_16]|uniref:Uncharacterized protein n=1 Tax=Candidatus Saganbacteria bacterium CG08_land_8_20_14_0_20_45_16 TaxID=2014293 RepID=A0A2H0XXR4_UNCSA|nr:MAG: hypothetical protein COT42_04490 [Candidatus Saganbacteria bacterium CG08_land_8_20_14_0_20_45_16]
MTTVTKISNSLLPPRLAKLIISCQLVSHWPKIEKIVGGKYKVTATVDVSGVPQNSHFDLSIRVFLPCQIQVRGKIIECDKQKEVRAFLTVERNGKHEFSFEVGQFISYSPINGWPNIEVNPNYILLILHAMLPPN